MSCSLATLPVTKPSLPQDVANRLRRSAIPACCSGRVISPISPSFADHRPQIRQRHSAHSARLPPLHGMSLGGDEGELRQDVEPGTKIRVTANVTIYHVPKMPNYKLKDKEGEILDCVSLYKGKQISANLPYKCQFLDQGEDGKEKKITAHLAANEFEKI